MLPLFVVLEGVVVDDLCPVLQQCEGQRLVLGVLVVQLVEGGTQGAG